MLMVPVGVNCRAFARAAEIIEPVAPLSHNAFVGAEVGRGLGGLAGSNASETRRSVTTRLARPLNVMVNAWKSWRCFFDPGSLTKSPRS